MKLIRALQVFIFVFVSIYLMYDVLYYGLRVFGEGSVRLTILLTIFLEVSLFINARLIVSRQQLTEKLKEYS